MVVMVLFFVTEVDPTIIVKDVQDGALGLAPFPHTKRIGTKTVVTGILWHSTWKEGVNQRLSKAKKKEEIELLSNLLFLSELFNF